MRTKQSILFSPKHRSKSVGQIDISYKDVKIKQYSKVTYLGYALDECLTGESMTMQVCIKVTSKLKFLYRKNRFLSKDLRRLLCNALIQPHFDYACAAWYPNLNKKYKNKLQVLQNKCIYFCLQLDNIQYIGTKHFDKISWLPIDQRFKQVFLQAFLNSSQKCVLNTWTKFTEQPIKTILLLEINKALSQKCLSYLGSFIWNDLPDDVKLSNNENTFKHQIKKTFLTLLR